MTLRELFVAHRAADVNRWDHTAQLALTIAEFGTLLVNAIVKRNVLPTPKPEQFHPYAVKAAAGDQQPRLKITSDNFNLLRTLFVGK
jgi:hypothetical protein